MQYNHIVQAAVYNSIDPELSEFLHRRGFPAGGRTFKLFAFSRLQGLYAINKEGGAIRFSGEIKLVISSPLEDFCQSLANTLLTRGFIRIGSAAVAVEKVYVRNFRVENESVTVRTLSPVVLYSTLLRLDGRKYTCYFQPGDPDYDQLLGGNLQKKFRALYGSEPPAGEVRANTLGQQRLHVVTYKGTVIKGYTGRLQLTGPAPLLQIGVDAGLGGKNAQGFGCVEVVEGGR